MFEWVSNQIPGLVQTVVSPLPAALSKVIHANSYYIRRSVFKCYVDKNFTNTEVKVPNPSSKTFWSAVFSNQVPMESSVELCPSLLIKEVLCQMSHTVVYDLFKICWNHTQVVYTTDSCYKVHPYSEQSTWSKHQPSELVNTSFKKCLVEYFFHLKSATPGHRMSPTQCMCNCKFQITHTWMANTQIHVSNSHSVNKKA